MKDSFAKLEKELKFLYLDELEFDSENIKTKIIERCKKKLQKPGHFTYNRWSKCLFEKDLQAKNEAKVSIEKIHPLVGYGVVAKEFIPALRFVGEYTGLVRKRRWSDRKNDYAFGYVIGPHDTPWVIDASEKGNFTRFFNHSYTPNLMSRWIISDDVAHIGFFSTKVIKPGDQLTFDYGPYYWRNRPVPQDI